MGLLDRLFKKDPEKELTAIEAMLANGEADDALERARRLAKRGDETIRQRAEALRARAHHALADEFLGNAERAETAGSYRAAADWLETALEHIDGDDRRQALSKRIEDLIDRAAEAEAKGLHEEALEPEEAPEAPPQGEDMDEETHYVMLTAMLQESWSARYEELPAAFRQAYLAMNSGDTAAAKSMLDALAEQSDEPIYRFERARCALMLGDAAAARADLEAVWPALGDDPVDLADHQSVPALWADALLRLGDAAPVADKLEPLADPALGREQLAFHYGAALIACQRHEEAVSHFAAARKKFEGNPLFPLMLAQALDHLDDWSSAVQCLEKSVGPSCAAGTCAIVPKHPPSIRMLIALYLKQNTRLDRAGELLMHLEQGAGGNMTRQDLLLKAERHRLLGEEDAATAAAEAAAQLEDDTGQTPSAPVASARDILAGDKAVL